MMKKRFLNQLVSHWKTWRGHGWFTKRSAKTNNILTYISVLMIPVLSGAFTGITAAAEQTRIAIAIDPEGQTCVLGGGVNGILQSAELITKLLKPRQDFKLYNLHGRQNTTLWPIGQVREIETDTCNPHYRQKLSLTPAEIGKAQVAIFDGGSTKRIAVLPKILQTMNIDNEKYSKILSTYLESQKLKEAPVKIHQLIRTDLNGDGKHEIIINAINTKRVLDRKGEYSIVLVVREGNGKPVVEAIQSEITLEDSDLPVVLWENTIAAIADIDADGKMEIIMYGQFYHGQGWDLVRSKNLTQERPIICGCGG